MTGFQGVVVAVASLAFMLVAACGYFMVIHGIIWYLTNQPLGFRATLRDALYIVWEQIWMGSIWEPVPGLWFVVAEGVSVVLGFVTIWGLWWVGNQMKEGSTGRVEVT